MNNKVTLDQGKNKNVTYYIIITARICIGCLFLYSGITKIRQPYDFLSSVYAYELVGPKLGQIVSMALPWAELYVGICLIGGIFVSGALLLSVCMGIIFIYVISSALYRDLNISCGCFEAVASDKIGYKELLRAIVLMLLSLGIYVTTTLKRI